MNVRAREDAEMIYKSVSTTYYSTDQKALLNIVGRRSNQHMQLVRDEFEKLYGKDLVKEIDSNVSFKFKKLLVGLVKSYPEYRGEQVYDSLKGLITDKWALVDFIIGNDPISIEEFKQFFRQKYGTSLSDMIAQEVSGDFQTVLLLALEARRGVGVEEDLVEADVLDVFRVTEGHVKEGVGKLLGTIMTQRSYEHLAAVSGKYKQRHNQTLEEALNNCISGWFQTALISCLDPLPRYWAKRVRQSLKSFFTDDSLLVRCFSQCSKPFLQEIAVEYLSLYEVTLVRDIKDETSGDYGDLLLTLLDYPENEKDLYSLKMIN